jgi:hypothetical protein
LSKENWGQPLTGDEDKHMNEEFNEIRDFGSRTPLAFFKENRSQSPALFLLG